MQYWQDDFKWLLNKVINADQTGFIPGRHGINNIRRTLNIMSIAQTKSHPSLLLSLDAEEAFDRVDWVFLQHVLNEMGFDKVFIDWFETLYTCPTSRVHVNGYISDSFQLKRGTRQGCPWSPLFNSLYYISGTPNPLYPSS